MAPIDMSNMPYDLSGFPDEHDHKKYDLSGFPDEHDHRKYSLSEFPEDGTRQYSLSEFPNETSGNMNKERMQGSAMTDWANDPSSDNDQGNIKRVSVKPASKGKCTKLRNSMYLDILRQFFL